MSKDFRKSYYSQLGVQAVEVKNSLDSILSEEVIEVEKIGKLVLNYRIPSLYRPLVWKILLGCLSPYRETWEFVGAQQREVYDELRRSSHYLYGQLTPPRGQLSPEQVVQLSLVASGLSRWYQREQFRTEELGGLRAIAYVFLEYCEDDVDAFVLFHAFIRAQGLLQADHFERSSRVYSQINQLSRLLKAHDSELFESLRARGIELDEFGLRWFRSYFAESLSSSALERIMDVVISGSPSFVVFVALSILLKFRGKLLQMKSAHEVKQCLMMLPDVNVDPIVNHATELLLASQKAA